MAGRPAKEGARRTVRLDPELDAVLADQATRLDVDVGTVIGMGMRSHLGLAGGPSCRAVEDQLRRARDAEPHLRVAFRLLTGTDPERFEDPADAITKLGPGAACEVWYAWWLLRPGRA